MSIAGSAAAELPPMDEGSGSAAGLGGSLEALMDVTLPVVIEIGRTQITVQDVLALAPGSVIEIDRAVGEPVDIYVGDRRFAQGEVVVVGDTYAVRITRVLTSANADGTA